MPPAPPVFLPSPASTWVRWLRPIGVTLTIVGVVVLGAVAFVSMITLMSDPATPQVGFMPGPDGAPRAVVARAGADEVTTVELEDADQSILWAIDRVPGSEWDGVVVLGTTPAGFVPRTALEGTSLPGSAELVVSNGCYASYESVPVGSLTPGVVTIDGDELGLDEFHSDGAGFTPCGATELRTPLTVAVGALVVLLAGLGALVASGRLRAARRAGVMARS